MTTDDSSFSYAPADIQLPERYRLMRHVADGGMASVWCAHDSVLARKVAVKILSPQFQYDARAVRRFGREARAAARLSAQRNIVTIYDVGDVRRDRAAGNLAAAFIVMEYLAGGTVADALRAGDVSPQTARGWIREAAAAIDYAHRHGVVHGDIKPGNLLLDSSRSLHIADFGIARVASDETITNAGMLFGTASYMSPEQALGGIATEASDRYSLAVVAFELLVGQRPFSADGFASMARRHVDEDPPAASVRNTALPATLDPVLARGLAKRPEQRWPTATALANAVEAALEHRRVTFARPRPAGGATIVARSSRPPRFRLRPGALAALAALALIAGVALGLSSQPTARHPRHVIASVARRPAPAATGPAANANANANAKAKPEPAAQPVAKPTPAPVPQQPVHRAPAPPLPPSAGALEARGHSMMLGGSYAAAIPVLQQAMRSAAPGSLLYQWSLFDLGHSYRELGDLAAAIPLLQERMRYADQRPVVAQELRAALRSLGGHRPH